MLIAARNAIMGGKRLPYDAKVEYLESTGTQWIDTEVKPSADLSTRLTFSYSKIEKNVSAFGSRSSSTANDRYWINYDSNFEVGYGEYNSTGVLTSENAVNTIVFNEVENGEHTFVINGRRFVCSGTPNQTVNIIVFGRIVGAERYLSAMRLYDMRMVLDGTLVRDFIPVRVGSVGYMYDRVTKQLFGNQGTGAFIVGPDV